MKKDLGGTAHKLKPNRLATVIIFGLQLQPRLGNYRWVEIHSTIRPPICLLTFDNIQLSTWAALCWIMFNVTKR